MDIEHTTNGQTPDWYRLDASGFMYPMIKTWTTQSLFCISAHLNEDVNPAVLEQAVNEVLLRYPYFKVALKHGFFRFYLKRNDRPFPVFEDNGLFLEPIRFRKNNGYPLRIRYYRGNIKLECFHALCDGNGAMDFLKSVVFCYLSHVHPSLTPDASIRDLNSPVEKEEYEDAYLRYYNGFGLTSGVGKMIPEPALGVQDDLFLHTGYGAVRGMTDAAPVLARAKAYGCSVTEFITAAVLLAVTREYYKPGDQKSKVVGFVPIDLRKMFPSRTLRNFVTFLLCKIDPCKTEPTLAAYIKAVADSLPTQATDKQLLESKLSFATLLDTQPATKLIPQAVESLLVKAARSFGRRTQSIIVSNLGVIKMPPSSLPYIDGFSFFLNCNHRTPKNFSVLSFNGRTFMGFSRRTVSEQLEETFFNILKDEGIDVEVSSNGRSPDGKWQRDEKVFCDPPKPGRKYLSFINHFAGILAIVLSPILLVSTVLGAIFGGLAHLVLGKNNAFFDL